jgi:hypothetical protein
MAMPRCTLHVTVPIVVWYIIHIGTKEWYFSSRFLWLFSFTEILFENIFHIIKLPVREKVNTFYSLIQFIYSWSAIIQRLGPVSSSW